MRKAAAVAVVVLTLGLVALQASAQVSVPKQISFQARLADAAGKAVADGDYQVTFGIYDVDALGTPLWTETQTVTVTGGVFSALLGSVKALDLAFDAQYWLAIEVASDGEMTPRFELASAPYAMRAASAATADAAGDADTVDGAHAADLLDKATYDVNGDGKVDSAAAADTATTAGDTDTLDGIDSTGFADATALADPGGVLNDSGNPVDWSQLKNVPPGFADGVDDGGGVDSITVFPGLVVDSPTGDVTMMIDRTQVDSWYVETNEPDSITTSMIVDGTVADVDLADGAALAEIADDDGAGSGLDADMVDGSHASAFADASHAHSSLDAADGAPTGALVVDNNGNVGIGKASDGAKLEVDGDIRLGIGAALFVPGALDSCRIVYGEVNDDGTLRTGQGFTSTRTALGTYQVTFDSPFPGRPVVIATVVANQDDNVCNISVSPSGFNAWIRDMPDALYEDDNFTFVAIGPR